MPGSPLDLAVGAGSRIGRYFAIVSVLPSALLVLLTLFVHGSVVDGSTLDMSEGLQRLASLGVEGLVWAIVLSILLGLLLHPIQFALTQLMEGYWGPSRIGVAVASHRIRVHRRRVHALSDTADSAEREWTWRAYRSLPNEERARHRGRSREGERLDLAELRMDQRVADFLVPSYVRAQAADKAMEGYPIHGRRVMPTRLGNILRRHEDLLGSGYGLDLVLVAPYLATVADPAHYREVEAEGEQMDLSIRMCLVLLISSATTASLWAPTGWGALLALVPYAGAYLAYRAACVSAAAYMSALAVVLQLNRFALYRSLGLGAPRDSAHEMEIAAAASLMLANEAGCWTYNHIA